jgi:hypothetical protein
MELLEDKLKGWTVLAQTKQEKINEDKSLKKKKKTKNKKTEKQKTFWMGSWQNVATSKKKRKSSVTLLRNGRRRTNNSGFGREPKLVEASVVRPELWRGCATGVTELVAGNELAEHHGSGEDRSGKGLWARIGAGRALGRGLVASDQRGPL